MFRVFTPFLAALMVVVGPVSGAEDSSHLNKRELKALLASAATAADHLRLAQHYKFEATQFKSKQEEHQIQAAEYYRNPGRYPIPKYPTMGQHCRDLAGYYGKKTNEATRLMSVHEAVAGQLQAHAGNPN